MAIPFGSLQAQRSRVLPQGGAVLGQLTGSFQSGLEAGRLRAAEDQAPNLIMDYLDTQASGYQPQLGALMPATGYVAGQGQAPQFNGTPTQANADLQTRLTPGSETFDGRFALRRENASQQNPPPVAPYATNLAGYGSNLTTTGLDAQFGTALDSAIAGYLAQGGNPADIQINSLVRSNQEQQAAWDRYQRGEISLAARPGTSRHEYGAAADIQPGQFLDWLHQNAGNYGLSFLTGDAFARDPVHVQLAGPSPAGTRAPAIPAGGGSMPASGGGYSSQPAWTPPTGQERALLRAMIVNPVTRQMGIELATQRMMPPQPQQPNWQIQEFNGSLYRIDTNTGQVQPLIQGQPDPAARDIREGPDGIPRYVDTGAPVFPGVAAPATPPQTRDILMPDGQVHVMGFNPATGAFDLDQGLADPGGQWTVTTSPDGGVTMSQGRGGTGTASGAALQAQYLYDIAAPELPIVEENFAALAEIGNQVAARGGDMTYWTTTPEYQRAANSLRVIIQNYLYSVTGAAAPQGEVDNWFNSVMPRIGESTEAVADKLQRVRNMVDAMQRKASASTGATPAAAIATPPPAAPTPIVTPAGAGGPAPTLIYDPNTNALVPVAP